MIKANKKSGAGTVIAGMALLGGVFVLAGGPLSAPKTLSQAEIDASEQCADCHDDYQETLAFTTHRFDESSKNPVYCANCHSGAAEHIEDPSTENIGLPSAQTPAEVGFTCSQCHEPHVQLDDLGHNPHLTQDFSCLACHKVHQTGERLLVKKESELCADCHPTIVQDVRRRSAHPVTDGQTLCLDCHNFVDNSDARYGHGADGACARCHPEQSGSFLYEHDAAAEYLVEGSGCVSCHNPHGSEQDRLRKHSGDNTCLQCHVRPPLHETQHGGLATRHACVTCHSDIHGSYISDHYLREDLPDRLGNILDCFASGCHDLEGGN